MRKLRSAIIAFAAPLLLALLAATPALAATPQAGESSVYHFNIAATATHGAGKLMINVDQRMFVFNGKGFDPKSVYALYYRTAANADLHLFASAVTTQSGNLHLAGTWTKGRTLVTAQGFSVGATGDIPGTLENPNLFVSANFGSHYTLSGFSIPTKWPFPVPGVLSNMTNCTTSSVKVGDAIISTTTCDATLTAAGITFSGQETGPSSIFIV